MKSRLKQLGKDSLVYGIGGVAARGIGFFLLPIYTRIFAPSDYGIIEMLTVINSFLAALLVMGMDSAQSFYFFEQKDKGRKAQARVVTAIVQWRLICGTGIVGAAVILSPFINVAFFDGSLSWEYFAVAFVGTLFGQLMIQSAEVFRLLYRPWAYIGMTLGNAVLSATVSIALVVWLNWGVLGYFIGFGIGSVVAAIIGWWAIRAYIDWSVRHWDWWPKLVRFGAPLVPAGLAMYVLTTADRWFINHYYGSETVGIYAVGAKFAMMIAFTVVSFRQAWWPIAMDAMQSADGPELFRTIARLYLGFGVAGVLMMTALSPLLVRWLTSPAYHAAYPIVGVLAWHSIFYGFYLISAGGIWKAEKTIWATALMGTAALINVALDAWLVPEFGGIGAAIATSISSLVWIVLTLLISEKLWPVGYAFDIFGLQISIGIAGVAGILLLFSLDQEAWKVALLTTSAISILMGLTIDRECVKSLLRQAKSRWLPITAGNG